MTSFERYFSALKKALGRNNLYSVWPDFEPHYNIQEYVWTSLRGLGEVLLLNCGLCDGPCDLRHSQCKGCVEKRGQIAIEAYQKATGRTKQKWATLVLCRIHTQ